MRFLVVFAAGLAAALLGRGAVAEGGGEGVLTIDRIFGGPPLAKPLPDWEWRPGHAELVRTAGVRGRRVLLSLVPETGAETELLDLTSLDALVPGDPVPMSGIGRAGPPELLWTPDGRGVVVPVRGDLVHVDLGTGTRQRLTGTRAPLSDLRMAPDGSAVSFSREHELWVTTIADRFSRQVTSGGSEDLLNATLDWVYPEELGHTTAAWWSPDSRRIAYLQLDETGVTRFPLPSSLARLGDVTWVRYPKAGDRNPVARVGVVAVAGGRTTWLDLGTPRPEYVARVAWFPDGRTVAVVTLDRAQRTLRLLACDATTGLSRVLLEETDPAWVDVPPPPRFLDERTFLWRSHRDGAVRWWHVRLDPAGGAPALRPVTPPGMDADALLDYDAERSAALVTGTLHGESREGIWVAAPAAVGEGIAVRPAPFAREGEGTASAQVHAGANLAVVTVSGATTPPRREVRRVSDGWPVRILGDSRTDDLAKVPMPVPEYGSIEAPGGRLRWRLWKPRDLDETRRHPVIVRVYGGPGSRMVSDGWGRGPLLEALLVERGFLVFELDGRGTGGQGARFERAVQGRLGLPELEDQVRGIRMLAERPYVDGARVGIWGWSYGGTMACNALCMRSDVFRAGVAVAPVTDWRLYDTIYTERYMGLPSENERGYDETSSVRAAARMGGRLLLLHGMADDNVHVQNTFRLVDALLKARKTSFEAMVYPEGGHGLGGRQADVFGRLVAFFEANLR